jgi:dTMP kinase
VPTPVVTPTNASGGPLDETAVLPPVRDERTGPAERRGRSDGAASGDAAGLASRGAGTPASDSEVTAELPQPSVPPAAPAPPGAADETAVLPPVKPAGAADETAVLPPVRDENPADARGEDPSDRVPPGYFRDERPAAVQPDGSDDRTRELPQVGTEGGARRRKRPDWAEETPLDDLPTLADELLGPREDDDDPEEPEGYDDGRGGGRGRGRGRRR